MISFLRSAFAPGGNTKYDSRPKKAFIKGESHPWTLNWRCKPLQNGCFYHLDGKTCALECFTKTPFLELGLRLWFFSLGPIETTFRKYTFHKNRFFYPHRPKMTKKWPKMTKKNVGNFFSFPSYGRFREGTPQMRQNFCNSDCLLLFLARWG